MGILEDLKPELFIEHIFHNKPGVVTVVTQYVYFGDLSTRDLKEGENVLETTSDGTQFTAIVERGVLSRIEATDTNTKERVYSKNMRCDGKPQSRRSKTCICQKTKVIFDDGPTQEEYVNCCDEKPVV